MCMHVRAYTRAQVREQAAWFWAAPEGGPSAEDIRAGMGELGGIRCVAKYAARMGQCFSSTVDAAHLAVPLLPVPHRNGLVPSISNNDTQLKGLLSKDMACR